MSVSVLVLLNFKMLQHTTFPTKWAAASEAVKGAMFVLQLLQSMNIKIKFPRIVYVDNIGAIFMSKNITHGVQN